GRPRVRGRQVGRAAVGLAAIVVMTTVPVTGLRAYQQRHASTLLDAYVHAPRAPLPMTIATVGAHDRVVVDGIGGPSRGGATIDYVAGEGKSDRGEALDPPGTASYDAPPPADAFSTPPRPPTPPRAPPAP